MHDELRLCECGKEHPWGVVGQSEDHVPLYGPRPIAACYNFRPKQEQVPAFVPDVRELWAQTTDLDPQVEIGTRTAIARIRTLPTASEQLAESLGLLISQQSRVLGFFTRTDSKFARLVAHTDEVLIAMEGVAQLKQQLSVINQTQTELLATIAEMREERELKYSGDLEAYQHFGLFGGRVVRLNDWLRVSAAAERDEPVESDFVNPDEGRDPAREVWTRMTPEEIKRALEPDELHDPASPDAQAVAGDDGSEPAGPEK